MSTNLKAYEQQIMDKNHYRKLISAKTTISHFSHTKYSNPATSRTITPLDRYEYRLTNDRIRNKLTQIYKEAPQTARSQHKRRKRKHSKSVAFGHKEKERTIHGENVKFYQKLITAKSTIGTFKDREKELKKYGRITRKKSTMPNQSLYLAFRQIMVESKASKPLKTSTVRRRPRNKTSSASGFIINTQEILTDTL